MPKVVVHEVPKHIHQAVPLRKEVPVAEVVRHVIVDEIPHLIRKPKVIIRTRTFHQPYRVDRPVIEKTVAIKPVVVKRPRHMIKNVVVPRKVHKVQTVVVPEHIDVPVPVPEYRKVVKYHERKIFRPRPVVQEKVRIRQLIKRIPVEKVVIKHEPQARIIYRKKPVNLVRTVHKVHEEPVPVPEVKTVPVQIPIIHRKKVYYKVPAVKVNHKYKSYDD